MVNSLEMVNSTMHVVKADCFLTKGPHPCMFLGSTIFYVKDCLYLDKIDLLKRSLSQIFLLREDILHDCLVRISIPALIQVIVFFFSLLLCPDNEKCCGRPSF